MNFNKLTPLRQDLETYKSIATSETAIFQYYAENCSINEWLKIFHANPTCALWMCQHLKSLFFVTPQQITLTSYEFSVEDEIYLNHFLTQYKPIRRVTIPQEILRLDVIRTLEKLEQLTHIRWICKKPSNFLFYTLH